MALAATIFAGSRPACLRLTSSAHQKCFMPRRSLFVPRCRWSGINPYPLQLNDSAATTVAAASTGCSVQEELMIQGMTTFLDKLKYNSDGLVAVIVQHVDTGEVLMQAYADRAALSETLQTRLATFYSRSRKGRWCKGETSGHFINVQQVFVDCDSDSIIYLGEPVGPACHTGARVCWFSEVELASTGVEHSGQHTSHEHMPHTTLYALEEVIKQRRKAMEQGTDDKPSWTARLISKPELLCRKVREEAGELCETLEKQQGQARTTSEMADLLYHAMVLCNVQGVSMEEVLAILRQRFTQSGIEEKAKRQGPKKPQE